MIQSRRVSSLSGIMDTETRAELDSHADTCVVGKNALIFHDYGRPVNVMGYNKSEGTAAKNMRTVTAALAYDDPTDGTTRIVVINQAIEIPHLDKHLLCSMQMRMNDVRVDEIPKFLTDNPTDDTHAVVFPHEEDGKGDALRVPLSLHGVTSYFPVRCPTQEEYETCP